MESPLADALREVYRRFTGRGNEGLLTDAEQTALLTICRFDTLPKGDFFAKASEPAPRLGFLLNGLMRMYHVRTDGEEVSLDFVEEFGVVGSYETVLLGQPSGHYVQALTDCQLITLNYADLLCTYEQHPRLERLGREVMSQYLAQTLRRLTDYMRQTPEERYQRLLGERPGLLRRVPQLLLASYVGVTPVSLSRIRRRLAEHGN